jgi:hypothetical protein
MKSNKIHSFGFSEKCNKESYVSNSASFELDIGKTRFATLLITDKIFNNQVKCNHVKMSALHP